MAKENIKGNAFQTLSFRDKLAYVTCIASFVLGWAITWAGFLVSPIGSVHDSVLWILGQSLIYCASVLGLTMYVTSSFRDIKHKLGIREHHNEDISAL